jgi:hypothetical protein
MKALMLIVAITVVALALAYFAISAVSPGGFYMGAVDEAQIVRKCCRVRLVQPEWVSSKPSTLMNWCVAETYARLAVVGIFWLGAVIFTIRFEMSGNENMDAD